MKYDQGHFSEKFVDIVLIQRLMNANCSKYAAIVLNYSKKDMIFIVLFHEKF